MEAEIEREKTELAGLMVRRLPSGRFRAPEFQEEMAKVEECIECGDCRTRCPSHLGPLC